jgi:hypothetical protein
MIAIAISPGEDSHNYKHEHAGPLTSLTYYLEAYSNFEYRRNLTRQVRVLIKKIDAAANDILDLVDGTTKYFIHYKLNQEVATMIKSMMMEDKSLDLQISTL